MFFGTSFTSYTTYDLLYYITGDKHISDKEYYECIDILQKRTEDSYELEIIIKYITTKLNSKYDQWKDIYKNLKLVDILLKCNTPSFAYQMKYKLELIEVFKDFKYEVNGAINIQEKAKNIYMMLTSEKYLEKERKKFLFEKEKEMKEEKKNQGGLLNSLGTYAFNSNFNDLKKYDLTGDDDDKKEEKESDEESESSSNGSEDNQNYYQKMKKEQLKKEKKNDKENNKINKNNPNPNNELFEFECKDKKNEKTDLNGKNDLFMFEFENDLPQKQEQTNINKGNNDLINMNEFMNPIQDNQVKMINLQQALKTVQGNNNNMFDFNVNSTSSSQTTQPIQPSINNPINPNNPFNFISDQQNPIPPSNTQPPNQTTFDLLQF